MRLKEEEEEEDGECEWVSDWQRRLRQVEVQGTTIVAVVQSFTGDAVHLEW